MKLKKIRIGQEDLPIRIDYNVIEAIEEEFDTLEKFRMELLAGRGERTGPMYTEKTAGQRLRSQGRQLKQ